MILSNFKTYLISHRHKDCGNTTFVSRDKYSATICQAEDVFGLIRDLKNPKGCVTFHFWMWILTKIKHLCSGADKSHEFSEQHNDKPEQRKQHSVLLQRLCWGLTVETEVWVNKSYVCKSRTETGSREIRLQYLPGTRKCAVHLSKQLKSNMKTDTEMNLDHLGSQLQKITQVLNKI